MAVGFGTSPAGRGPSGMNIPSRIGSPEDNLLELREKLCLPGIICENKFNFATGIDKLRVDNGMAIVNQLAVTIQTGTVLVFLGEADSSSTLPAFEFTAGDTIFVKLPPHEYVFTIIPKGGISASGNLVCMAI